MFSGLLHSSAWEAGSHKWRVEGRAVGESWGSRRGANNVSWGYSVREHGSLRVDLWVANNGYENVWFAGKRMNGHRGWIDFRDLRQRCSTGVQCFCWKSPHSCCEFTAQLTAGDGPHFLFFHRSYATLNSQWAQNTLRWAANDHTVKWNKDQWGERVKGYGCGRRLDWHLFEWCSMPQHFCYS